VELDKKGVRMTLEQNKSFLDLYLGLYDLGANLFQDKQYQAAYNAFSKAQVVEDYILAKNYTYEEIKLGKLDTNLILNTAAAALNAGDSINAVTTYKKLADANLSGKDYLAVYEFLAGYYKSKRDKTAFDAILAKGKSLYPQSNYWTELEMAYINEGGDKKALLEKYEETYKKQPNNFNSSYNYAVELYNVLYDKNNGKKDSAVSAKLTEVLKTTINVDEDNLANMLMGNHLYNQAADYSQESVLIKETKVMKPADLKKKKMLNDLAVAKLTELIPYAEKSVKYYQALPTMKNRQKSDLRLVAGYLTDAYNAKKNPAKAAEYDKIRESVKF
jgi:hypothetical protein